MNVRTIGNTLLTKTAILQIFQTMRVPYQVHSYVSARICHTLEERADPRMPQRSRRRVSRRGSRQVPTSATPDQRKFPFPDDKSRQRA